MDELARLGVAALAGEYHSVVARAAAARADALRLPFLCSSAVLDALTEQATDWVARLAPAQSHGWQIYADFLLRAGHLRIAVAAEPSVYWASGARILRERLAPHGGTIIELDLRTLTPAAVCVEVAGSRATALLLLAGYPEPAVSIVRLVRRDQRLAGIMIGAPAGQPEFAEWTRLPGDDGAAIPFLRYLPERLTPLGARGGGPARAAGRGALLRRLRGLRHGRRPGRGAPLRRRGPGSSGRVLAPRFRRGHPRADHVLPRAGHQRLAVGLAGGQGRGPDPAKPDRFRILPAERD